MRQGKPGIAVAGLAFMALASVGIIILAGVVIAYAMTHGVSPLQAGSVFLLVGLVGTAVCIVLDS